MRGLGEFVWRWTETNCPWTNVYGCARTLLALGTALTLGLNPSYLLFRPAAGIPNYPICQGVGRASLFCMGDHHLEIARWTAVLILLVTASGWRPRYTAVFQWWVAFSLTVSAVTLDGGDQTTATLTLLLLPVSLTDNRRWHWQTVPCRRNAGVAEVLRRAVALTALMAIRFQVAIIYFHAVVGKLSVTDWVNGTVLYYWFTDPTFGLPTWLRGAIPLLTSPFVVFLTWSVLLLEIFLFMALVMPKELRNRLLIFGLLFHAVIAVTMGLVSFGLAMAAALLLYLRPIDQAFVLTFGRSRMRPGALHLDAGADAQSRV